VRALVAGDEYVSYRSLAQARRDPAAAVIFEGDSGAQLYLTCPVRHVRCDEDALRRLLADLDAGGGKRPGSAGMQFERSSTVADGVWLHPDLDSPGLRAQVDDVIAGVRPALDLTAGRRAVWRSDLTTTDRPADLGLVPSSDDLLGEILDLIGAGSMIEGALVVYGFGSFMLRLGGGKVTLLSWPARARVVFDGVAHDAEVDFAADAFEYERLVALLRGVLDDGLAVRAVGGPRDEVATVILMTFDEDGEADHTYWAPDPVSVDWLSAQLGPVERLAPMRGGG
jgi:hypothetical protein